MNYIIFTKPKPLFKTSPIKNQEKWEKAIDFTKIKEDGINIDEILSRLQIA